MFTLPAPTTYGQIALTQPTWANFLALENEFNLYVYNVKDFGAKGDNVHDDTAAIQAALTAASGNHAVYFPFGKYLISSTLTLTGRNFLYGDGPAASVLFFIGAAGCISATSGVAGQLSIKSMGFIANAAAGAQGTAIAYTAGSSLSNNNQNLIIRDVRIDTNGAAYWTNGLVAKNIWNSEIDTLTWFGNALSTAAITIEEASVTVNIINCNIIACITGILFPANAGAIGVQGVNIINLSTVAVNTGVYVNNSGGSTPDIDINIYDSYIEASGNPGICINYENCSGSIIASSTCDTGTSVNGTAAVLLGTACNNIVFIGCAVTGSGATGTNLIGVNITGNPVGSGYCNVSQNNFSFLQNGIVLAAGCVNTIAVDNGAYPASMTGPLIINNNKTNTVSQWNKPPVASFAFATTPYNASIGDWVIIGDATGGNIVCNLPAAAVVGAGFSMSLALIRADAAANTFTVARSGADTITTTAGGAGLLNFTLAAHAAMRLESDGVSIWHQS